jgi:predicted tellurium resistance membrane protein TerC
MALVADGLGQHIPKGYIYFAMGFSVFVEMLNLRIRDAKEGEPVHLRSRMAPAPQAKDKTRPART